MSHFGLVWVLHRELGARSSVPQPAIFSLCQLKEATGRQTLACHSTRFPALMKAAIIPSECFPLVHLFWGTCTEQRVVPSCFPACWPCNEASRSEDPQSSCREAGGPHTSSRKRDRPWDSQLIIPIGLNSFRKHRNTFQRKAPEIKYLIVDFF